MKYLPESINKYKKNKLTILGILMSFVILLLSLALTYRVRSYNSDDVGIQNALLSWSPFSHQTLFLSPDTWIANMPFYYILEHIFSPSRHLLFIEGALFALINLVFFYIAVSYFYKKINYRFNFISLLPILWVTSFGYSFARLFLNTNLRNYEIGLSFILFMIVAKIVNKEFVPLKSKVNIFLSILYSLIIGVLALNDPMYIFYTIIPISIFLFYIYIKSGEYRQRIRLVYYGFLVSGVFYYLTKKLIEFSGIKIYKQVAAFAPFSHVFSNISLALHGLIIMFGADVTSRNVINLTTIGYSLNLLLLIVAIYIVIKNLNITRLISKNTMNINDTWISFFSWEILFIFIIYSISNQLVNLDSYRYMVMIPFLTVFIFTWVDHKCEKSTKQLVSILFILSIIFNVGTLFSYTNKSSPISINNRGNSENYSLINLLEKRGLHKGYAEYWNANINSYLSKSSLVIYPVVCDGQTVPFNWFINQNIIKTVSKNSFIIIDYSGTPMCSEASIMSQFGKPQSIFKSNQSTVFIYNYDIGKIIRKEPKALTY